MKHLAVLLATGGPAADSRSRVLGERSDTPHLDHLGTIWTILVHLEARASRFLSLAPILTACG